MLPIFDPQKPVDTRFPFFLGKPAAAIIKGIAGDFEDGIANQQPHAKVISGGAEGNRTAKEPSVREKNVKDSE